MHLKSSFFKNVQFSASLLVRSIATVPSSSHYHLFLLSLHPYKYFHYSSSYLPSPTTNKIRWDPRLVQKGMLGWAQKTNGSAIEKLTIWSSRKLLRPWTIPLELQWTRSTLTNSKRPRWPSVGCEETRRSSSKPWQALTEPTGPLVGHPSWPSLLRSSWDFVFNIWIFPCAVQIMRKNGSKGELYRQED